MPLVALWLINTAVGLVTALVAARELRSSPRALVGLKSFAALVAHACLVVMPASLYLLVRHTDWMLSYAVHGSRVPSALALVATLAQGAGMVGGFALGARWLREHRGGWASRVAGVLALVALVGALILRERVGAVGTTVQFRGGFGLAPFASSRALASVALVVVAQAAAYAHMAWSLRASTGDQRENV